MFNAFSNELQFTLKNKLQNKSRLVFSSSTAPKVPDLNSPHSLSLSSSSFSRSTTHISPSNSICQSVAAAARSRLLQLLSSLGICSSYFQFVAAAGRSCCCCSSTRVLLLPDPAAARSSTALIIIVFWFCVFCRVRKQCFIRCCCSCCRCVFITSLSLQI